jgi:hypothetical protein
LLEDIGYGKNRRKADVETIGDFLYRIPEYLEVLGSYKPQDNRVILDKLDELLVDDCNLAREYHKRRKKKDAKSEDTGG